MAAGHATQGTGIRRASQLCQDRAMKKLRPDETELVCKWRMENGRVVGNEACDRIDELIFHYLRQVADIAGWDFLYQDPEDGRYWELTYPHSEMQGGGPPRLDCISPADARRKYTF